MNKFLLALSHGLEFIAVVFELPSAILMDLSRLFARMAENKAEKVENDG